MKKKGLKMLVAAIACTMVLGTVPPSMEVPGFSKFTMTAEAAKASKKINITVSGKSIYVGKNVKLSAKVTNNAKLSYKSSNRNIVTVNGNGVLTGKKAGTAKITITAKKSGYKTVKKTVTVKVTRQNQSITAGNKTVTVGKTVNLNAKAKTSLSYKSSNTKIATVDKKGNVKAKASGTAKITISAPANGTYNKASRSITVKVTKLNQNISASSLSLTVGQSKNLNAKAKTSLSYISSNAKIATVDKKGNVRAVSPGTVKITISASANGTYNKASRIMTLKISKKPVTPPKQTETIKQPETEIPKDTEKPNQTESVKQTESEKQTEPKETEVPKPSVSYVTEMHFDETSKTNIIYIGESKTSTLKWTATGTTTRKDFIYTSSDPSIATVDENGTITGLKPGDVRITAKSKTPFSAAGSASDCLTATQRYRVKIKTTDIDSMYYPVINGEDAITEKNIGIGETKNCTLRITASGNGSVVDVDFISSDPSVATVDEKGNVTGLANGYVTITAKTKLPSEMDGVTILTSSTTYHVGKYTYEEILNGLTMDTAAGWSAHETMNDLRKNPSHRNFFKDYPSYPEREWAEIMIRPAATRAARNIICHILGGWNSGEMSTKNPLASHKGNLNGYGGGGWESTGSELGKAASVFFEDMGHFSNEVDPSDKYEAIAVVQYKNPAGVNLTSMIVQAGSYPEEASIEDELRVACMPESQFMDFCHHFGIPTTDPKVTADQVLTDEDLLPVEEVAEVATEVPEDVIVQEEDIVADPEMVIEEDTDEPADEAVEEETEMEVSDEVPETETEEAIME